MWSCCASIFEFMRPSCHQRVTNVSITFVLHSSADKVTLNTISSACDAITDVLDRSTDDGLLSIIDRFVCVIAIECAPTMGEVILKKGTSVLCCSLCDVYGSEIFLLNYVGEVVFCVSHYAMCKLWKLPRPDIGYGKPSTERHCVRSMGSNASNSNHFCLNFPPRVLKE